MRNFSALVILTGLTVGCSVPRPTAPDRLRADGSTPESVTAPAPSSAATPEVIHHNIPATTDDGRIVWLCSTQPRAYSKPNGSTSIERDHYISSKPCPAVPIE